MVKSTPGQTHIALGADLNRINAGAFSEVLNDANRGIFTTRFDGAIFEFAHRQADSEFWCGVKYYGSGKNSRVRIRRTPMAAVTPAVKAKRATVKKVKRTAALAEGVAAAVA